jgi:GNAT superfamily N-acetyltransferase
MYSPIPVTSEALPRFCAAAGHPLRPEAVARQAADYSFLLEDGAGDAVARCSLWWRQTPPHEVHRLGYLGHYAVADPESAPALFRHACDRLAAEGCTLAVGPLDGNTWQRYRLLTERGSEPPFFLEPDNPDEWPGQFSAAGFAPLARYCSALNPDLGAAGVGPELAEKVAARGITVRPLRPEAFDEELRRVHALSLLSFRDNFLYTPITLPDFLSQHTPIRPYLRPDLVLLAERAGELVGYIFAIPDLLQAQRGVPVDTVIVKTMAVHPDCAGAGLGNLLMGRCHEAARAAGFTRAVHALFHEANRSGKISAHTARIIRRYTLFARPVGAASRAAPGAPQARLGSAGLPPLGGPS